MEKNATKAEVRAWKARWEIVNTMDTQAARTASPDDKFRELDLLFRSRDLFRWREDAEVRIVRDRWLRLKGGSRGR